MTNFHEWTNTLLYKNIPLTLYSKGLSWLCVRGELETGTDCYIFTQTSSEHSSTSFSSWQGCSTMGHWGPKALYLPLALTLASCPQLTSTGTRTDSSRLWHLVIFLFDAHLLPVGIHICTEFNHVHRSRWYSNIFDWMHLFRCSSTYSYRCISWLMARSRVNMLHIYIYIHIYYSLFLFICMFIISLSLSLYIYIYIYIYDRNMWKVG